MGTVHKNKSKLKSQLKDEENMPKHPINLYTEQIQQPKFDRQNHARTCSHVRSY